MQSPVLPGSWIGMFGGGQLGRMFTHAAQRLGYHVAVYDCQADCPAAQAADLHFCPASDDPKAIEAEVVAMSQKCAVLTLEFENIPAELLRLAGQRTRVSPGADFLEMCQDRVLEKTKLSAADFPVTPFREVASAAEIVRVAKEFQWPIVLKTARSGYDGKGQLVLRSEADVAAAWETFEGQRVIAEKWIEFEAEVSMITARNALGQTESYPLLENEHANHILNVTRCPVSAPLQGTLLHGTLQQQAQEINQGIAEAFGVIGLFCVEYFATDQGTLLINEIAPRPHNSGHLTIEAFTCSQFEQQVRAICNLPLVPAEMLQPAAMINILGDVWANGEPNWSKALSTHGTHLHLYGKSEPHPSRKMGHLTLLDQSSSEAAITAKEMLDSLHELAAE